MIRRSYHASYTLLDDPCYGVDEMAMEPAENLVLAEHQILVYRSLKRRNADRQM